MQLTHPKPTDIHLAVAGKRQSHTLRLSPQASEIIKDYAETWGVSRADVVSWCVCNSLAPQPQLNAGAQRETLGTQGISEKTQDDILRMGDVAERFERAVATFEAAISRLPAGNAPQEQKATHLKNKKALQEKEIKAPHVQPNVQLNTHPDFSEWSDGACLNYEVSLGGVGKKIREWIEPLRDKEGSAHANARKSIPRSMRRGLTPPEDLVRKVLRKA